MPTKYTTKGNVNITFPGLLTILFIGLKLAGVITWSWWWVLAPLWIPWIIVFGFMFMLIIISVIGTLITRS